jgi:hypothetical protein
MELPSCRDIGGEEPNSWGFCPVDFYVPCYADLEIDSTTSEKPWRKRTHEPKTNDLTERTETHCWINGITKEPQSSQTAYRPLTPRLFYPFGFVAGCVWGDDSSWKVQYLDLAEAGKGIVRREERFGYIELPDNLMLKEAVSMIDYGSDPQEDYSHHIHITIQQRFDLRTGQAINECV